VPESKIYFGIYFEFILEKNKNRKNAPSPYTPPAFFVLSFSLRRGFVRPQFDQLGAAEDRQKFNPVEAKFCAPISRSM